ncbi:MAG: tRNA-dihydrouridine synthase [Proteobacteria bacterium]|jgi:tRNA-dihydrouridine synthase B|nr:tRNA-dihydrouridine synthase [Pseudomonadota bacterium]
MQIRDVTIDPKLILAPMEGVTDVLFRRLIRQIGGVGLTVTEFIAARALHFNIKTTKRLAAFDDDEHPIAIQVYGREPQLLAEAAQKVQDLGADIVDLNMGCPAKKVCRNSGGSSLMKDLRLSQQIVCSMRRVLTVPFTVKMRAGWDHEHRNAVEMAAMCEEEGVDAVAVHWRTRTDRFGGVRDIGIIAEVKDRLGIPVIANGDVVDVRSALDTLTVTNADALMIGRGAVRNPWIFRQIEAALSGMEMVEVPMADMERVLLHFLEELIATFETPKSALGRFKMVAKYFCGNVPGGSELRYKILHSQTVTEARDVTTAFFASTEAVTSGQPPKPARGSAPAPE